MKIMSFTFHDFSSSFCNSQETWYEKIPSADIEKYSNLHLHYKNSLSLSIDTSIALLMYCKIFKYQILCVFKRNVKISRNCSVIMT